MALAMGMQMSIARLGTALALGIALPLAKSYSYSSPVLLAFVFMLIALSAFIIYTFMDKKLDASIAQSTNGKAEDAFELKDILFIIKNKGFWYIAILCVLFYSAVFPFLFYATDLMINKYHVNPNLAGSIPALLPFGTIFLTPLFGTVYDKKGKGATIMIIGSVNPDFCSWDAYNSISQCMVACCSCGNYSRDWIFPGSCCNVAFSTKNYS